MSKVYNTAKCEDEANILHESGVFYAYKTQQGIEIRKNHLTHSTVIGMASSLEHAKRFITRANLYPNRF